MKKLDEKRFGGSLAVAVACLCVVIGWQQTASMKVGGTAAPENRSLKVHVRGLKSSQVNLKDGVELSEPGTEGRAPAIALATADFDSDGTPDLVTADQTGRVRFRHGNPDTIYPNSAEAKAHLASHGGELSPFELPSDRVALTFAPDFFLAGDFNADGKSDILATSKGLDSLLFLSGNGKGDFAEPRTIVLNGQVTALTVGEIGRKDGQTDVAVATQNKAGAQLLVFEHPEGAFKHKPESFPLPAAASDLAIGQLDTDSYGDVVIAGGSDLTIVHGRGQAYPLDLKAELNIQRPAAFTQTRQFAFDIGALAIGRFTASRGDSLAMLAADGTIYTLEPGAQGTRTTKNKLTAESLQRTKKLSFAPAQPESARKFATLKADQPRNEQEADQRGQLMMDSSTPQKDREKLIRETFEKKAAAFSRLSAGEQTRITAEGVQRTKESNQNRKEGFERTLSSRPIPLGNFKVEAFISDTRLVNAAHSSSAQKLITARFSDSGQDDLVLVDSIGKRIQIVAQIRDDQRPRAELDSLDADSAPLAILPMRLNADALTDLVILREGSAVPTVVTTESSLTLVVNTTDNDSGGNCDGTNTCALRRAIFIANSNPGSDTITFNIPGAGVHTIHPLSALPDVTGPVVIDGTSQPGFAGTPLIEIEGDLLTGASEGLKVMASVSVIRGLAINHIPSSFDEDTGSQIGGSGITVLSTSDHPNVRNVIVEGNFLGTDPTGEFKKGNDANGVHIFDADSNTVGGTTPQARNILSGNGNVAQQKTGVGLAITAGNDNLIEGNYIGVDASGVVKLGNSYGVFFTGINNQFGGDAAGAGNVVSGNGGPLNDHNQCFGNGISVIALFATADDSLLTNSNNFKGNLIGTTANGEAPLGNCTTGITSNADINTSIGSITEPGRNVISDNGWDAIWCAYTAFPNDPQSGMCTISGNNIGTDKAGNVAIANDERNNSCVGFCLITDTVWVHPGDLDLVVVGSPGGTTPGGACTGFCNLISGNYHTDNFGGGGLFRTGFGMALAVNNYIGTNRAGTAALPNNYGSWCYYGSIIFGAELSDGNGGLIDGGNLASGNKGAGFILTAKDVGGIFEVSGNLVGMSSDGNNPIPNGDANSGGAGMNISTAAGTEATIGGTDQLQKNVVGATMDDGFSGGDGLSLATYGTTRVINNWIGLNKFGSPLPNTGNGISVTGTGRTFIGGVGGNENNVIFGNGKAGVAVFNFTGGFSTVVTRNVTIRGNIIASNGGLGIDLFNATQANLGPDGVTPNDCQDMDTGANDLQNFPILFAPVFNANGTVTINGLLGSEPLRDYTIDFYSNSNADSTNYGEGANIIGTTHVTTGGFGSAVFEFTSTAAVSPATVITATATSQNGSTSEFSCAAGVCTGGSITKEQLVASAEANCQPHKIVVNVTGDEEEDPNSRGLVCNIDPNATPGTERCTLRAAIQEAITRKAQGPWVIEFNIPGSGVHIISPATALPTVTASMSIDATTQPGYAAGVPLIEVEGAGAGAGVDGLHLAGKYITVQGLVINRFSGNGILIDGGSNNTVAGCFIGLASNGLAGAGNKGDGIKIVNGTNNEIGGTDVARRNIISANGDAAANTGNGITITGTTATSNGINGNYIGTDAPGNAALGNRNAGIYIISNPDSSIEVGTTDRTTVSRFAGSHNLPFGGNLISGNAAYGIAIIGTKNYFIAGNLIGTDHTGNVAIPNGTGIYVKDSAGEKYRCHIDNNLISGNDANGISIVNSSEMFALYNYIGTTDITLTALGNDNGILLTEGSHDNIIGESLTFCFQSGVCGTSVISGNRHAGILIEKGSGAAPFHNYVDGNRIGTDLTGRLRVPNETGVSIQNSQQNTVWLNHISGNTTGISISGASGDNNRISSNNIGADHGLIESLGNTNGIVINSSGNTVGMIQEDPEVTFQFQNIISGNSASGIVMRRSGTDPAPTGNTIDNNCIGTDADCVSPLPNTTGVLISDGAHDNFIGTGMNGHPNVISGNSGAGISIEPAGQSDAPFHNFVNGNFIGVVKEGLPLPSKLSNQVGVRIQNSQQNLVRENIIGGNIANGIEVGGADGGNNSIFNNKIGTNLDINHLFLDLGNGGNGILISSSGNLMSGNYVVNNSSAGILLQGDGANLPPSLNTILRNFVGTSGGVALPNGGPGVLITNGASNNVVGGQIGEANIISGNAAEGVLIQNVPGGTPAGNKIVGNRIGADVNGTFPIPNLGTSGVFVQDSDHNQIDHNQIMGESNQDGIDIVGSLSTMNLVRSNCIGLLADCVTPRGNILNGILIASGAHKNSIGGPNEGDGNRIVSNKTGVVMDHAGCCNMIDPNSIYANTIIGIDLNNSGMPIPNDAGDGDSGPNNLQNFPEFSSAIINTSGNLILRYEIDSAPGNSDYGTDGIYVEFFKADATLQGKTFVGSTYYTVSDYNNGTPLNASFSAGNAAALGVVPGDKIVATATDAMGNTSEFTSIRVGIVAGTPTAADGNISGRITDIGTPVSGATITLSGTENRKTITDSQGNYRFDNVEANGFYTVTPARVNYDFAPPNRSFSLLGLHTEASFAASPNNDHRNAIDSAEYFVRQQYLDFLNREPDEAGLNFWVNNIERCGEDAQCRSVQEINTSAAFFLSIEFQQTGYLVYRMHQSAYGELPGVPVPLTRGEFLPDIKQIGEGVIVNQPGWADLLENNRQAFAAAFVQRSRFTLAYPPTMTPVDFVDKLFTNARVTPAVGDRSAAISEFGSSTTTADTAARGRALLHVAENSLLRHQEFNRAFVLMQFFGYLRRNPNDPQDTDYTGYDFWLTKLNQFNGNYINAEMVKAFISSIEYRQRFAQ